MSLNQEQTPKPPPSTPHLPNPLFRDQNVRRIQVAVYDRHREGVHVHERPCAVPQDLEPDRVGKPVLLVHRAKIALGAELKDDCDLASARKLAKGQDPDDVGVPQLKDELDLPTSLSRLQLAEELDGDGLSLEHALVHVSRGALSVVAVAPRR